MLGNARSDIGIYSISDDGNIVSPSDFCPGALFVNLDLSMAFGVRRAVFAAVNLDPGRCSSLQNQPTFGFHVQF